MDVCLLISAYVLTWWCYSACTSRLSTAPQALVEASPYVLLPLLLIISSAVLGTLFFSMLMHAFVAANGTFSRSSLLSDFVGGVICGLLMIPYQRKRFSVPGETPALRYEPLPFDIPIPGGLHFAFLVTQYSGAATSRTGSNTDDRRVLSFRCFLCFSGPSCTLQH